MSEKMYPIPFKSLMNWIVTEYAREGEIFGVHTPYYASGKTLPIFSERIETPFGPAAGPNSQLAQNIIAAYFAGARFFEVKTVQKMDGAELAACVPRPCILAADEGYNQEWSTELEIPQARDEYIKAWCALKILSKVYGLGDPNGFVFNMSVGYDLDGIKGEKVNTYIDNMMDASETKQFKECLAVLTELFPAEKDFIASISPRVSRSVTVSTLHGCPPQEIERIASYLLAERVFTPSSSATRRFSATRPHARFSTPWATITSSSTSITLTRTCSGSTPFRCSSACRRWQIRRVWNLV